MPHGSTTSVLDSQSSQQDTDFTDRRKDDCAAQHQFCHKTTELKRTDGTSKMGRIRVYRVDDDPSKALTYSELSQVEISSKKDHPDIVDDNDHNFKVKDLKRWVEEKTGATPIQQVYYHCCSANEDRNNSDNSEPYRYLFESSPSLNGNNNGDDVPLRITLARYYEKVKLQRCTYIKKWIGVRLLHHEDEPNTDGTTTAVVDSAAERRAPKRRRRSS